MTSSAAPEDRGTNDRRSRRRRATIGLRDTDEILWFALQDVNTTVEHMQDVLHRIRRIAQFRHDHVADAELLDASNTLAALETGVENTMRQHRLRVTPGAP